MEYFFGVPPSTDQMWLLECDSVAPYCNGRGLDPGSGGRTFSQDTVTLDIDPERTPQHVGDAQSLPFGDAEFDYVIAVHLFEHMRDSRATLREWLRVLKVGGHACLVIPSTEHTNGQNTDKTKHCFEWTPREFLAQVGDWSEPMTPWWDARPALPWCGGRVIDFGVACPSWSFKCVVQKCA